MAYRNGDAQRKPLDDVPDWPQKPMNLVRNAVTSNPLPSAMALPKKTHAGYGDPKREEK